MLVDFFQYLFSSVVSQWEWIAGALTMIGVAIWTYMTIQGTTLTRPNTALSRRLLSRANLQNKHHWWSVDTVLTTMSKLYGPYSLANRDLSIGGSAISLWGCRFIFTNYSYFVCLLIAFVYPLFLSMAIWTVSGDLLSIDGKTIFADNVHDLHRYVYCALIVFIIFVFFRSVGSTAFTTRLSLITVTLVLVLVFNIARPFVVPGALAFTLVFAFAIAGAITGSVVFASSFALVFAVASAFAVAATFAIGYALGTISDFHVYIVIITTTVICIAFAGAFAVITYLVFGITCTIVSLLLWWMMMLSLPLIGFYIYRDTLTNHPDSWVLLIYLFFLPLVNALMDWLSINITRGLLRRHKGLEEHKISPFLLLLGIDFIAALILMALTYFFSLHILLGIDSFRSYIFNTESQWHRTWSILSGGLTTQSAWFYLMVATTFLPTVFYLAYGVVQAIEKGLYRLCEIDTYTYSDPAGVTRIIRQLDGYDKPTLAHRKIGFYLFFGNFAWLLTIIIGVLVFVIFASLAYDVAILLVQKMSPNIQYLFTP